MKYEVAWWNTMKQDINQKFSSLWVEHKSVEVYNLITHNFDLWFLIFCSLWLNTIFLLFTIKFVLQDSQTLIEMDLNVSIGTQIVLIELIELILECTTKKEWK